MTMKRGEKNNLYDIKIKIELKYCTAIKNKMGEKESELNISKLVVFWRRIEIFFNSILLK